MCTFSAIYFFELFQEISTETVLIMSPLVLMKTFQDGPGILLLIVLLVVGCS